MTCGTPVPSDRGWSGEPGPRAAAWSLPHTRLTPVAVDAFPIATQQALLAASPRQVTFRPALHGA